MTATATGGGNMTTHQRKTAIVTGASQGIGAGLVEAFLKLGYNVVGNSRNITEANPRPKYSPATGRDLPNGPSQRVQVAAVRFALAVEQLGHVRPCFLAADALVQLSVELPFDETVIDFGGSNFPPDMAVSGRVCAGAVFTIARLSRKATQILAGAKIVRPPLPEKLQPWVGPIHAF